MVAEAAACMKEPSSMLGTVRLTMSILDSTHLQRNAFVLMQSASQCSLKFQDCGKTFRLQEAATWTLALRPPVVWWVRGLEINQSHCLMKINVSEWSGH